MPKGNINLLIFHDLHIYFLCLSIINFLLFVELSYTCFLYDKIDIFKNIYFQ